MSERIQHACLLLALASLPFSIALAQLASALAILAWLAGLFRGRRPPLTGLEIPLLLFLAWIFLSLPFAENRLESVFHLKRWLALPLIWMLAESASGEERRKHYLLALLLGIVGASLLALPQKFGYFPTPLEFQNSTRVSLTTNPMTAGALMAMGAVTLLGFLFAGEWKWKKARFFLALLPVMLALLLTETRSCWLGFLAGLIFLIFLRKRRALPLLFLGLLLTGLLLPSHYQDRFLSSFRGGEDYKSEWQRLHMWKVGAMMVRDRPLTGFGDCDLKEIHGRYIQEDEKENVVVYGHLHSNLAMFAVLWGIPGLFIVLLFLFRIPQLLYARWQTTNPEGRAPPLASEWTMGVLAAWAAFFVAGLFEWYFGDGEVILLLWMLTGIGLAREEGSS